MRLNDIQNKKPINWNISKPRFFKPDEQSIFWVNIEDLFNATDPGQKLDLYSKTGGQNIIGNRVNDNLKYMIDGNPIDPSEIYPDRRVGIEINFQDGRHRLLAAWHMGHDYAPVIVDNEDIEKIKKIIKIHKKNSA